MGSEFAYEDITSQEVDKYDHLYVRDEVLDGLDCFVLERRPRYKKSGYKRQFVWIDKEHYRPIQIVFHDRKDSVLKTLNFSDYQLYNDKFWRADKMLMTNHITGKSTVLEWSNYRLGTGLEDSQFNKNALKRIK